VEEHVVRVAVIVLAIIWACLPSICVAQDARYNFASAQGEKRIAVTPGGQASGVLYFYNAEGNRITHINLAVVDAPSKLAVEIDPPPGEIELEIGGSRVVVSENLYVEPAPTLFQPVRDVPDGSACIGLGENRYAVAKVARVVVRAPEGTPLGPAGPLRVSAEASWLGQTGAAAMKQARDFDFTIEVVASGPVAERVIGEVSPKPADTPRDDLASLTRLMGDSLPAFAAGALALLGIMRVAGRVSKNKGGKE
jgi:hypothetical protein